MRKLLDTMRHTHSERESSRTLRRGEASITMDNASRHAQQEVRRVSLTR